MRFGCYLLTNLALPTGLYTVRSSRDREVKSKAEVNCGSD
jgi:hypothetical protein